MMVFLRTALSCIKHHPLPRTYIVRTGVVSNLQHTLEVR
jgi:hypothetical protein